MAIRQHFPQKCDQSGGKYTEVQSPLPSALVAVTTMLYDDYGRMTSTVDAEGGRTTFVFDSFDRRVRLEDPLNNKTTFAYDAVGQLTEQIDPNGNSATFAYDGVGRLQSATDRIGRRRDYDYDEVGRKTAETWVAEDGSTIDQRTTFTYDDALNELTASTAGLSGTFTYELKYDALDRVTHVAAPFSLSLTLSYDAGGNRTLVEDSLGGVTTSTYDELNRLTRREFSDGTPSTALAVDQTYTALGMLESITRWADVTNTTQVAHTTYTYNTQDPTLLENLKHANGGGVFFHTTYSYDEARRLATEIYNTSVTTYNYDDTHQVTNEINGGGANTITYDANGNRDTLGAYSYDNPDTNQLTEDPNWSYNYDEEGNLKEKEEVGSDLTWFYTYDQANHLIRAERATDGVAVDLSIEYRYDPWGNLVARLQDDGADSSIDQEQHYAIDAWKTGPQDSFVGLENSDVWAVLDDNDDLQQRYVSRTEFWAQLLPNWDCMDFGMLRVVLPNC